MRPVTFSSCADEPSVVPDYSALETLVTESCRANIDVGDPPPVVVTLQDPYHQRWPPVPSPIDKGTISR